MIILTHEGFRYEVSDDVAWDTKAKGHKYIANLEGQATICGTGRRPLEAVKEAAEAMAQDIAAQVRQAQYDYNPLSFEGDAMWVSEESEAPEHEGDEYDDLFFKQFIPDFPTLVGQAAVRADIANGEIPF